MRAKILCKMESEREENEIQHGRVKSVRDEIDWKKAKGNRVQVILECTEHKASGMPGTSRYITTKNRKNTTERLELKKYNPILKRVTVHKEIK